ncbi:MAG: CHAP domain-containing protein, partial [Patescibacteria group bacterium]|nr:CHAP domain-containing protein [Patescibacteria group bacterium]
PGVGNAGEESPEYSFEASSGESSRAEAGAKKPGDSQSYYYRYLGSLQCAKERVMQVLQPFITGSPYTPFATDCFRQPGEPGPAEQKQPTGATCTNEKIPLDFDNNSTSPIAQRAWKIVSDLYQGFWCYWNRSPGDFPDDVTDYPPSYPDLFDEALFAQIPNPTPEQISKQYFNMFWCTWLVIKAFNETGYSMPTNLLYTPDMMAWFQSQGKYLEAGSATYQDVAPGDAVFFRIPPDYYRLNHVAIVYSVTQDGITTVESNAGYKTMFYPTDTNGHFQEVSGIKIEGFGRP